MRNPVTTEDLYGAGLRLGLRETASGPQVEIVRLSTQQIIYQESAPDEGSIPFLLGRAVTRLLHPLYPHETTEVFPGVKPEDMAFIVKRLKENLSEGEDWKTGGGT